MIVKAVKIEASTAIKIFAKHNVLQLEVYQALKEDDPIFRKTGGDQYLAIGLSASRHITIFFRYDARNKEVNITTAYPSDKGQVRFYKKITK